uniref:Uncharacterized protein n=1 Tax=Brassica campestris TaxID=3711 RepID=M4EH13_BRACM
MQVFQIWKTSGTTYLLVVWKSSGSRLEVVWTSLKSSGLPGSLLTKSSSLSSGVQTCYINKIETRQRSTRCKEKSVKGEKTIASGSVEHKRFQGQDVGISPCPCVQDRRWIHHQLPPSLIVDLSTPSHSPTIRRASAALMTDRESTPLENEPPELLSPPMNLRTRAFEPPRWKERQLQRHHRTTTTPSRCS